MNVCVCVLCFLLTKSNSVLFVPHSALVMATCYMRNNSSFIILNVVKHVLCEHPALPSFPFESCILYFSLFFECMQIKCIEIICIETQIFLFLFRYIRCIRYMHDARFKQHRIVFSFLETDIYIYVKFDEWQHLFFTFSILFYFWSNFSEETEICSFYQ